MTKTARDHLEAAIRFLDQGAPGLALMAAEQALAALAGIAPGEVTSAIVRERIAAQKARAA